jgi:hypothetical protein
MALNGEDTYPRRAAFHGNAAPRASLATGKGEKPRQKQRVDQWITTFPVNLDLIDTAGDNKPPTHAVCTPQDMVRT